MRFRKGFASGTSRRQVLSREINFRDTKFRLSRRSIVRISMGTSPFLLMAFAALYLEQIQMFWFSLAIAAAFTTGQLLVYGYSEEPSNAELKATHSYSKGALIFAAAFWSIVIAGGAIALYLKFPDS